MAKDPGKKTRTRKRRTSKTVQRATAQRAANVPKALAVAQSTRALALKAMVAPPEELDDRTRVLIALDNKRTALVDSEGDLRDRLSTAANGAERGLLLEAIRQTINEEYLVGARFTAISSDQPFSVPAPDDETALLNAIQTVGRLADENAAVVTLVEAALNLVATYKASSTN